MRLLLLASSRSLLPLFVLQVAIGCSPGRELFPMEVGRAWKYSVVDVYGPRMADVKVTSRVRVGQSMGFELVCDDGVCRMAWDGARLISSEFLGTVYHPPLTILRTDKEAARWVWRGVIRHSGAVTNGVVEAVQEPSSTVDLGREVSTVKVTLTVKTEAGSFVTETHYRAGVGILRQEVRRGDSQTLLLSLASGR